MAIVNTAPVTVPMTQDEKPKFREVGENTLTKDDFMKIFLKQMQMQDPMKPYDSSSMLQQMSQFTSLSATEELEKTIKGLNLSLGKSQELSAASLVGKQVQVPSDVSPLIKDKGLNGCVVVPAEATDVVIQIKDKNSGEVVATLDQGPQSKGIVDFRWDGNDANGNPMPLDNYTIAASATINGQSTKLETAGSFEVQSVSLDQNTGDVYLNLMGANAKTYTATMDEIVKIL